MFGLIVLSEGKPLGVTQLVISNFQNDQDSWDASGQHKCFIADLHLDTTLSVSSRDRTSDLWVWLLLVLLHI